MKQKYIEYLRYLKTKFITRDRNRNLCTECPDEIRGTCCYFSTNLREPDIFLCSKCPEHIRTKCTFPEDQIKEVGKTFNVMLSSHPCKFLDLETKLCKIYDNRYRINRLCLHIMKARELKVLLPECVYVKHSKKYARGTHKVRYEDIENRLCEYSKMTYKLFNESYHEVIIKY